VLQIRTESTISSGVATTSEYAKRVKELGYTWFASNEYTHMASWPEHEDECAKEGLKPLFGIEVIVVPDLNEKVWPEPFLNLLMFARTQAGLSELIRINNISQRRIPDGGFYFYPRVDPKILSSIQSGDVAFIVPTDNMDLQEELGELLFALSSAVAKDDVWWGLNFQYLLKTFEPSTPQEIALRSNAIFLAAQDPARILLTTNIHYLDKDDHYLYEIMRRRDKTQKGQLKTLSRVVYNGHMEEEPISSLALINPNYNLLLMAAKSMTERFATSVIGDVAIDRTLKFPNPIIRGSSLMGDIHRAIVEGWRTIINPGLPGEISTIEEVVEAESRNLALYEPPFAEAHRSDKLHTFAEYAQRLAHEAAIIEKLGFWAYFHIVSSICSIADEIGAFRGPGRGSAAGSIVSYLLSITKIDPLYHGLLFSRFLSEDRNDLPDIDMDFAPSVVKTIYQRLTEIYGHDRFVRIGSTDRYKIANATMALHAAFGGGLLDEAGEIVNYKFQHLQSIMKIKGLTQTARGETELKERLESSNAFEAFYKRHKTFMDRYVMRIQDFASGRGVHPAGVIISPYNVDHVLPIFQHSKFGPVTQWKDRACEACGFPKFDILTLEACDVIQRCLDLVRAKYGKVPKDVSQIGWDCAEVYQMMGQGRTDGQFQFNTFTSKKLTEHVQPTEFDHIVAIVALGRPGPMGVGADVGYAETLNGNLMPEYEHEDLIPILSSTMGFLIYQEQIIQLAQTIAGMTASEADYLRKACGKKKLDQMEKWEAVFKEGGVAKGYSQEMMDSLWEKIVFFAEYGFNKCLTGDTTLHRAGVNQHTGNTLTVEELYNISTAKSSIGAKFRQGRMRILHYDEDGQRVVPSNVVSVIKSGCQPVCRITLANGSSIKATLNHRFLTDVGYLEVSNMKVGDKVMTTNGLSRLLSIVLVGHEDVYDIEMAGPSHNFIANGMVSHNSHSVSYCAISYYQGWLKVHFPDEYWCASLQFNGEDENAHQNIYKLREKIHEAGYNVVYPTIHAFSPQFAQHGQGEIMWPVGAVKGIGIKAVEDLCVEDRDSFETLEEFFEATEGTAIKKNVVLRLAEAGFFDPICTPRQAIQAYLAFRGKKGESVDMRHDHDNLYDWALLRNSAYGFQVQSWKGVLPFHSQVEPIYERELPHIADDTPHIVGGEVIKVIAKRLASGKNKGRWWATLYLSDLGEFIKVQCWADAWEDRKIDIEGQRPEVGDVIEISAKKKSWTPPDSTKTFHTFATDGTPHLRVVKRRYL